MIVNHCVGQERYALGSADVTVRSSSSGDLEHVVATGILDGGFHMLKLVKGNEITLERNGVNPNDGTSTLALNEVRLYETVNLLQDQRGKVTITADTSKSLVGFEAINLLENL